MKQKILLILLEFLVSISKNTKNAFRFQYMPEPKLRYQNWNSEFRYWPKFLYWSEFLLTLKFGSPILLFFSYPLIKIGAHFIHGEIGQLEPNRFEVGLVNSHLDFAHPYLVLSSETFSISKIYLNVVCGPYLDGIIFLK